MPKFRFTPDGEADLDEVILSLARQDTRAARDLLTGFERAFGLLAEFPSLGHARHDLAGNSNYRFWLNGPFFIIYRVSDGDIQVLAVLHAARDIPAILSDRAAPID